MTRPLILIPGMGGSVLVHRGQEHRRILHKSIVNNRWLNIDALNRSATWKRDMHYRFVDGGDATPSRLIDWVDEIGPYEFGSIKGISNIIGEFDLLPSHQQWWLDELYNHSYMANLCDHLKTSCGYRDQVDLFGAPYDFRLILDPVVMEKTFSQIRSLIEHAVYKKGRRVVIVSHSTGGILLKLFLSKYVDATWRQRYIHHTFYVNVAFGGIPMAVRSVMFGEFYYQANHRHYRDIIQRNSAFIMCMPNRIAYGVDEPFVTVSGAKRVDIKHYREMEHENIAFLIWRRMMEPLLDVLSAPLTCPTSIIISDGGETPSEFITANSQDYPITLRNDPGDGMVPQRSMLAATSLFDHRSLELHMIAGSHNSAIRSQEFFNILKKKLI